MTTIGLSAINPPKPPAHKCHNIASSHRNSPNKHHLDNFKPHSHRAHIYPLQSRNLCDSGDMSQSTFLQKMRKGQLEQLSSELGLKWVYLAPYAPPRPIL